MKSRLSLLLLIISLFCSTLMAQEKFKATWNSLEKYELPEWIKDAKFGIFIHWGLYSVPGFESEWYPRNMYDKESAVFKHHVDTYGKHDQFGYKDFIPMFKAEKFDATSWVDLFKKAGARYIVPVAEHHDGFAMYKSSLTKWNAFDMGPHRDIVGEIAAATKKAGLVFGLSSHRIEHWWFFNHGKTFNSDVLDPKYADFYGPAHEENETMSPEYMNDWLLRNVELVEKYQPQLFWFDWWIEQPVLEPYRKSFASYYYNKGLEWNKGVAINFKNQSFPGHSAMLDIERGKLTEIRKETWQTDDALGYKSWGYIRDNTFKSEKYIINNLIDIVSKNGVLLLNIGPKPDGTITDEETRVLLAVGDWLKVNGEAIYETRPWKTFGEGPTNVAGGSFSDDKDKPFTADDVRYTTRAGKLYAISLDQPIKPIVCKKLNIDAGGIQSVEMVGSSQHITWKQDKNGLTIQPSSEYPSKHAVSYRIQMK
ncbi:MAG: alpha-L-fucosidase [Chitinophagaceae bacterium]